MFVCVCVSADFEKGHQNNDLGYPNILKASSDTSEYGIEGKNRSTVYTNKFIQYEESFEDQKLEPITINNAESYPENYLLKEEYQEIKNFIDSTNLDALKQLNPCFNKRK